MIAQFWPDGRFAVLPEVWGSFRTATVQARREGGRVRLVDAPPWTPAKLVGVIEDVIAFHGPVPVFGGDPERNQ